MRRFALPLLLLLLAAACLPVPPQQPGQAGQTPQAAPPRGTRALEQQVFWERLRQLCGKAYAGRLAEGNESDSVFARGPLVMHVRSCTTDEVRIPFHVGADRSRTWVLTRTAGGLRLKHDHRAPDGTEEPPTRYGGDARGPGAADRQDFPADAETAAMLPAARTNVWTVEVVSGRTFAYALRREGTDRRFRVEFDLRTPVPAPPPPWGSR